MRRCLVWGTRSQACGGKLAPDYIAPCCQATALARIASDDASQMAIVKAGGIDVLVMQVTRSIMFKVTKRIPICSRLLHGARLAAIRSLPARLYPIHGGPHLLV